MRTALLLVFLLASEGSFQELRRAYEEAVKASRWPEVASLASEMASKGQLLAVQYLHRELRMASATEHRRALFSALAFADYPEREAFVRAHLGSADPYYRARALEALARIDPARGAARAAELITVDDDSRVRRAAAELLSRSSEASAASLLLRAAAALPPDEQGALVRLAAGMAAGSLTGAVPLARDGDPEVRLVTLLALSASGHERFRPVLERARKDGDRRVRLVAEAGLARLAGDRRSAALRGIVQRAKGFDARWELYDLMARAAIRDETLREILVRVARGKDRSLRPKAAEALGAVGGDPAVPVLAALLDDEKPWQLPIGAARGLAASRSRLAIPPLIDALPGSEGRLQHEIAAALISLTGRPFGRDVELWRRWWSDRGATFQVPERPPEVWEEEAAGDRYAFYGISIDSRRAMFVCDISGSMAGKKLERLQRELSAVVRRFPSSGRFGLVFFNAEVEAWSKRLVRASDKAKRKALEFVEGLEANGATNLWGALRAGLDDRDVDTLVLLSDGVPSAGEVRSPKEIVKRFLKENRARMVLVHVVSIGQTSRHLRALARLSGGTYVER